MDKNSKLISIIVPAYNAENNLEKTLESLQKQTYENLEILVINDGSTDNTGRIAEQYAQKDQRICIYNKTNGGEANSRNFGLSKATGEYVAFCDADDYMHPDFIEKMYSALSDQKAEVAICGWNSVDPEGNPMPWKSVHLGSCALSSQEAQKLFLNSFFFEGFCWNKLFKTSLYRDYKIRYDENRLSYCDMLANYQMICHADGVVYLEDKLYDYYQMPSSCVHTPNMKKHWDYVQVLEQVRDAAERQGLKNEGEHYLVYRLNRYLFELYKGRKSMMAELKDFYIQAYSRWLQIPFFQKVQIIWQYDSPSPMKEILKAFVSEQYYKRLRKQS